MGPGRATTGYFLVAPLKKNERDERRLWLRQSGLLATIPFLLAVPPVLGLLIGQFLDNRFDTNPIFTIVLLILGFVAGGRETASVIKKANRDEGQKKDDARDPR